jgi:hypothetical protein
MDNRIFNVNGTGKEALLATLKLAFDQGGERTTAKGYFIDPTKGMVLVWHCEGKEVTPFPAPLKAETAAVVAWEWLQTEPAVECKDWDEDFAHDGHNSAGWRVYCEDWGHVAGNRYAIVAIKPAYCWHGK